MTAIQDIIESKLTKHQVKTHGPAPLPGSKGEYIVAKVRFDDECGNGHNSFSITATIYGPKPISGEEIITVNGKKLWSNGGGCCHDEISRAFPELAPLIKWHLTSTDGSMHYVANALYHAGHTEYHDAANIEHLKSTIVYGALPEDAAFDLLAYMYNGAESSTWNHDAVQELRLWLESRLSPLMVEFRKAVRSVGFDY